MAGVGDLLKTAWLSQRGRRNARQSHKPLKPLVNGTPAEARLGGGFQEGNWGRAGAGKLNFTFQASISLDEGLPWPHRGGFAVENSGSAVNGLPSNPSLPMGNLLRKV
jgi:hypothetical protein